MLHPVQEVFDANDQNGIVDVRVPLGLEARGEHESPTVIEDHQPRVPQTGLLYVLRVGVAQHLAEAATSRTRLLLVTRLDGHVRAHLRDEAVVVALARLLGNLALRLSCNCLILFLTGTQFPSPLCSRLVSFILKQRSTLLFIHKAYTVLHCILLILFYRCSKICFRNEGLSTSKNRKDSKYGVIENFWNSC